MDYETYWERSPWLVRDYLEAHELKIEMKNQEMYLQGVYNFKAFQSVIADFSWNLGGRKGAAPEQFLSYPIAITKREKEEERKRAIEKTIAWVRIGQKEAQ